MPLGCAYELARIAHRFQPQFFDAARTRPVAEFRATVQAFLKQYQEAERQGKLDAVFTDEFKPQAYMRPVKEVREELRETERAALGRDRRRLQDPHRCLAGGARVGAAPGPGERRSPTPSLNRTPTKGAARPAER